MAQVNRANAAVNLNLPGAWVGGVAPTSIDIAAWGTPNITTGPSQALGGAVSWQGILLQSAQTTAISIGTTSAAMTIGTSGIDLSVSGANLTLASPVTITLGANQQWTVASGRTLTVSGVVSGAFSLTKSGTGTLAFTTATTSSFGTGQTFTVGAGLVTTTVANALGSASNAVVVSSGGALRLGATPAQTSFSVTGSGNAAQPAAIFFTSTTAGFASGKALTLNDNAPTIGLNPNNPHAGVISGTPTGDVTLLLSGDVNLAGATLSSTQNFTVASGSYLVLQGSDASGTPVIGEFSLTSTDTGPFGNASNAVKVLSTAGLTNWVGSVTATPVTLSRDYFFEGQSTSAAPLSPFTHSVKLYYPQGNGEFRFTGTIRATAGYWVKTSFNGTQGAPGSQGIRFAGKLDGTWNLRSFATSQNIYLETGLDISTWTGALYANRVFYGVAPTGAATYDSSAVIDNISTSTLTLAHSGYTLVGNLTFTGSAPMSLGGGNVATGVSPTFTVSASTLTVPGTITGTGTFTKAAIGNLTLDGATSGYGTYAHTGGTLTLNSNNALGSSTAILTITAAVANTLDSTLGATLANTGANTLQANFTWGGSADLTLGSGATSWNTARTISFLNGKTGTLKFAGNIGSLSNLQTLSVGGTPVGGSRSVLWIAGTNGMLATTSSVTAGYLRVSNAAGLGVVGTTTAWTVSSGAAIEVDGTATIPGTKNATITGRGPNTDGALRSVSGTNVWSGAIVPPVQSLASPTRIQVDAGMFTLSASGSPAYSTINPTVSGTPLQFTALGSTAVLNQPRELTSSVSDVTINNGGVGTVVLSVANNHTGGTTVEGGTCKVTQINATSTGTVQVNASATLESTVQSEFTTLRLGTNGSGARAILKFAA